MSGYRLMTPLDPQCDMGKEMAVIFNLGRIRSAKYGEAELAGHFLHLLPYGKYPKLTMHHAEQAEKELLALLEKMGFGQHAEFKQWLAELNIIRYSAFVSPHTSQKNLELIYYLTLVFFQIDDMLTNTRCFKLTVSPTDQELNTAMEQFVQIVRGNYTYIEQMPELDLPLFKPVCKFLLMMRQTVQLSKLDITYFIETVVTWIRSNIWEKDVQGDENSYSLLRPISIGVYPIIEVALLTQGISVAKEIREHILYKKYAYQAAKYVSLFNDVFSVKTEIEHGKTHNLVLIKFEKYADLKISINKTIQKANQLLMTLRITGLELKSCFLNNSVIDKVIEVIACVVDGFLYYHQETPRYGQANCRYVTVEYCNGVV